LNRSCKERIIPIKEGGKYYQEEAFANLETGEVENVEWDNNPSNEFYRRGDWAVKVFPVSELYRKNYKEVFGHE